MQAFQEEIEGHPKQYATFKIFDRKNDKHVETSCAPDAISNLNPGGRNRHFLIAPPQGVSQTQFAENVERSGNLYGAEGGVAVPGYRIFVGPNSNSAAALPILELEQRSSVADP